MPAVRCARLAASSTLVAALLAGGWASGCRGEPPRPRGLLLVVVDTLRADALACYGGEASTPALCGLAARGTLFERAYSNAPWTPPSVVSLLSGNYSSQYAVPARSRDGRFVFHVPERETLLAEALAERGFDVMGSFENSLAGRGNIAQGLASRPPAGAVPATLDPRLGFDGSIQRHQRLAPFLGYLLGPRRLGFFMLYWFRDPHAPSRPRPTRLAEFERQAAALPRPLAFYLGLGHIDNPERGERKLRDVLSDLAPEELAFLRRLYLAEVESVDERVGYFLRALELSGRAADTVVAVTADHGEGFGEHGLYLHGNSYYDELMRVPLIVAGPGVVPGRRVADPVSHVDLMPTLADLFGVECLESPRGRSLARLLRGEPAPDLAERVHYLVSPLRESESDALVRGRFKLIAADQDRALELYDLLADPAERANLAAALPELARELLRQLRRLRAEERGRWEANVPALERAAAGEQETLRQLKALGYID
jgi:arylsulfatase A-like enzyme